MKQFDSPNSRDKRMIRCLETKIKEQQEWIEKVLSKEVKAYHKGQADAYEKVILLIHLYFD